jgi:hypothetical protein
MNINQVINLSAFSICFIIILWCWMIFFLKEGIQDWFIVICTIFSMVLGSIGVANLSMIFIRTQHG